jgi:hypothetical protein
MNKILTFFTAPVTAFFYPPVYRDAARSSAGRGVLYSLYLAGITVTLVMIFFSTRFMPQADTFVNWARTNMPVMIWTPAGLSLENGKTSAVLEHPQYGTVAIFDMTKTTATEADMGKAYIFVTATKVFIQRSPGQIEEKSITAAGIRSRQQLPPRVRIDGAVVLKLYQNIKSMMALMLPFLALVLSFMFFLVANLFYSLAGLLFNLMREEKLGFGAIFNLTCFATTPTFTFSLLRALTPVRVLAWPFFMNILINLVYLFLAFKITEKKPKAV